MIKHQQLMKIVNLNFYYCIQQTDIVNLIVGTSSLFFYRFSPDFSLK